MQLISLTPEFSKELLEWPRLARVLGTRQGARILGGILVDCELLEALFRGDDKPPLNLRCCVDVIVGCLEGDFAIGGVAVLSFHRFQKIGVGIADVCLQAGEILVNALEVQREYWLVATEPAGTNARCSCTVWPLNCVRYIGLDLVSIDRLPSV